MRGDNSWPPSPWWLSTAVRRICVCGRSGSGCARPPRRSHWRSPRRPPRAGLDVRRKSASCPAPRRGGGPPVGERLALSVNGQLRELVAPVSATLLEVLREDLGLTGTKHGCELGEGGACTVLIDSAPALACLVLPVEVQGKEITTVEGLAEGVLHPLQQAFMDQLALQGVAAVLTGADLRTTYGILPVSQDEQALCADKVRYVGDPVAAVAAVDEATAARAAALIVVEYEPLSAVLSIEEAMQPAAAPIHGGGNVQKAVALEFGDVAQGLREAADH